MTSAAQFAVGAQISLDGRPGSIEHVSDDICVVRYSDGYPVTHWFSELKQAHADHRLRFVQPDIHLSQRPRLTEAQMRECRRLNAYLQPLSRESRPNGKGVREAVISEVAHEIDDPEPPGLSTLSRWHKDWRNAGFDVTALVVRPQQSPARLPDEIEQLIQDVIDEVWLCRSQPSALDAYKVFRARYDQRGYVEKCPEYTTFMRRIHAVDEYTRIARREGKRRADEYARFAGTAIEAQYPLQRVEVDTAHFNIGLLNEEGYYVGVPTVYLVIDVYSRAILGYAVYIGRTKERSDCAVAALRYAIAPKSDEHYPMCGLPHSIITDSGPAYKSADYQNFVARIAGGQQVAPCYQGWAKPFVERFIRTAREALFQKLEGYLGKRNPNKLDDGSIKHAAKYTVDEFREILYSFIVDRYHHTPHNGLKGRTPYDVWRDGVKNHQPALPASLADLAMLRGHSATRTLDPHQGINYDYQRFHCRALRDLYDELNANKKSSDAITVEILADPLDASGITAINPLTGQMIEVPNVHASNAGKTFAEINAWRYATQRSDEAPYKMGDIHEVVRRKRNRRGPEVPLDNADGTFDLDELYPGNNDPEPDDSSNVPMTQSGTQNAGEEDSADEDEVGRYPLKRRNRYV